MGPGRQRRAYYGHENILIRSSGTIGAIAAGLMNLGIPRHRLQRAAGRSPGIKATMNISAAILTGAGAHFMAAASGDSLSDVSGGSSVLFVWLCCASMRRWKCPVGRRPAVEGLMYARRAGRAQSAAAAFLSVLTGAQHNRSII